MSYHASESKCDWCGRQIDGGSDVACRKCYEELEGKVADQAEEISKQQKEISNLEIRLRSLE